MKLLTVNSQTKTTAPENSHRLTVGTCMKLLIMFAIVCVKQSCRFASQIVGATCDRSSNISLGHLFTGTVCVISHLVGDSISRANSFSCWETAFWSWSVGESEYLIIIHVWRSIYQLMLLPPPSAVVVVVATAQRSPIRLSLYAIAALLGYIYIYIPYTKHCIASGSSVQIFSLSLRQTKWEKSG